MVRQLVARGFRYSKDPLGEYFERGTRRVSVMRKGPLYDCYVNDYVGGGFKTVAAQVNLLSREAVLQWLAPYI